MTTPHYYDQNKNLNPNPFDQQQQFDGQQINHDYYYSQQQQRIDYPSLDNSTQMINQQFIYDPFVNTARHLGGQFAERQKQKVFFYFLSFNFLKFF